MIDPRPILTLTVGLASIGVVFALGLARVEVFGVLFAVVAVLLDLTTTALLVQRVTRAVAAGSMSVLGGAGLMVKMPVAVMVMGVLGSAFGMDSVLLGMVVAYVAFTAAVVVVALRAHPHGVGLPGNPQEAL